MLVIGGRDASSPSLTTLHDSWMSGMNVFDMTDWVWTQQYDASAPIYERAPAINQFYAQGHATPNWTDPALATIFTTKTPQSPPPQSHRSNTGAIAGGVVGGIVGVIVLLTAGYWFFFRRQRTLPAELDGPTTKIHENAEAAKYEMEVPPIELPGNGPGNRKVQPVVSELDATRPLMHGHPAGR